MPWSGLELVLAYLLVNWLWIQLAHEALRISGFYRWYYGPGLAALVSETRKVLWVRLLAFPLQVLTYPFLFAHLSNARPEQLGLTLRGLRRNMLAGAAVLLAVAPAVFAVNLLIEQAYRQWSPESIQGHPFALLAEQSLTPLEWCLLVVNLVLLAPMVEELTYRGAIQPWLASRPWGGHVGMACALALSLLKRLTALENAFSEGWAARTEAAGAALFVLALVPIYLLIWRRSRSPVWPGIFAASLMFACEHSAVWPSPIPLFVLSLALGALAYRTQSLVGPFLMHGLFNGVSCLLLVLK